MAHGAPDYSNVKKGDALFRVDDMAELAVRLGSVVRYDRRGDVLWMTGFNYGLDEVEVAVLGAGSEVTLTTTHVESAPFAVRLGADGTIGAYAAIAKRLSPPASLKVGLGTQFYAATEYGEIDLYLDLYDGAAYTRAKVVYDHDAGELRYLDSTGAYVVFAEGLPNLAGSGAFTNYKMVADLELKEYVRVILGRDTYPLPGVPLFQGAAGTQPFLWGVVLHYTGTTDLTSHYVDNFVVTVNEP
jgi:hypothetical protein